MAEMALITLILPYYNEAGFIAATLASLAGQADRRFRLVLVDNASSDGSEQIARNACAAMPDISVSFLREPQPGKIHALRAGMAAATTDYVGTVDADTIYPPDYVKQALAIFARDPSASCALAFGLGPKAGRPMQLARLRLYARLFPRKCHTGGYGQNFRRDLLDQAGGFGIGIWPYVLEDHEIVHRMQKLGPILYGAGFFCLPSDRRDDRSRCSWSLAERIIYKLLPTVFMDWFFYRFLGPRMAQRGLGNLRLRERGWDSEDAA